METAQRMVDEDGNVIEGGFVDKVGYMGGWYRADVDVNKEVLAAKKDIEDGKSSPDVDYGMNKLLKEKQIDKHGIKKQAKKVFTREFIDKTLDSFGITKPSDYIHIQRQVFNTLLDEGFFTNAETRSRIDTNEEALRR